MNPSRTFILRPVATTMLMVGVVLAGLVAYRLLPISALPEVDYPTIQVTTFYPGASPDVMASSVTAPLERQFGQIQGLSQMTSTSSGGTSLIVLQFTLSMNIDVADVIRPRDVLDPDDGHRHDYKRGRGTLERAPAESRCSETMTLSSGLSSP